MGKDDKVVPEAQLEEELIDGKSAEGGADEADAAAAETIPPVSCCALLRFATCCDKFSITIGLILTCLNGATMPLWASTLGTFIHAGFMVRACAFACFTCPSRPTLFCFGSEIIVTLASCFHVEI